MTAFPHQTHSVLINDNTQNPNTGKIERATITLFGLLLSGATYDAELAKFLTLRDTMLAVQRGTAIFQTFAGLTSLLSNPDVPAPDAGAQRELGWIVRVNEVTTFTPHSFRIPCANTTFLATNREHMDTSLGVYTDLVAAIEAFVQYGGNAVTVRDVLFKGKNT